MIPPVSPVSRMTERVWLAATVTLSVAVVILTVWCLTSGITIIFMHLYYFPIVLLAYHYRWRGFGPATLLALIYLGLVLVFDIRQPDVIIGAALRVLIFVGVAAVIAYLSERLVSETKAAQQSNEIRERYISLAPAIILALDRNGTISFLNRKGGEILGCRPEDVAGTSWFDHFLPERDRDRVKEVFLHLMAGQLEPDAVVENPVLTCSGTERIIRWYNTVLHDEGGTIAGTLGYGTDITEEKQVQDSLRKMQQFQESVITNANVWISVLAPDGTLLIWNDAAEAISGYKKSEVVGKDTIWKRLYPDKDYRRKVTGEIQRIVKRDTYLENFETVIRCADGTTKTITWNTRALRDDQGGVASYIAIGHDVSAQRSAESRASESSRFLAAMIDTLPIPIYFKDAEGRYLGCNPPFEDYIGIKRDDLMGKSVYDISPRDLADKYAAADREVFHNPVSQRYETQVQYADGTRHEVIFYKAPFFNKDGTLGGLIGAFLDISERKRAEERLAASEMKFRQFFNTIRDALYLHAIGEQGLPAKFIEVNDAMCERLGYSRDELLTLSPQDIVSEVGRSKMPAIAAELARNGHAVFETEHRKKDGSTFPVEVSTVIFSLAGTRVAMASARDISERKRAEEALTQSEARYRTLAEASPDQIFINDRNETILYANTTGLKLFGLPYDQVIGKQRKDLFPPEMVREQREVFKKVFDSGEPVRQETNIRFGDLEQWIDTNLVPLKDPAGRVTAVLGVARDITERKEMEEKLRQNEAYIKAVMDSLPVGVAVNSVDPAVSFSYMNDNFPRFYRTTREALMQLDSFWEAVYEDPVFRQALKKKIVEDCASGDPDRMFWPDIPITRKGEETTFVTARNVPVPEKNLMISTVWDVSEQKRVERELIRNRAQLAEAMDMAHLANWEYDVPSGMFTFDDQFYALYGTTAEREGGYRMPAEVYARELVHPDDAGLVAKEVEKALLATDPGFVSQVEHRIIRRDGSVRHIIVRIRITKDAEGRTIKTHGANQDITELKEAEEALRESRQLFSDIISFLPDPTFVIDKTGFVLAWNRALENLSGVKAEDMLGKGNHEYSLWQYGKRRPLLVDLVQNPDQDAARMNYLNIIHEGPTVTAETQVNLQSGKRITLSLVASPLYDSKGAVVGAIESMRDITHIKETEAELSRFNANLENLVRERTRALEEEVIQRQKAENDVLAALDYTRSVIESNPDMVVVLDHEGTVLDINTAGESLTGLPRDQLIGKPYFGFLDDDGTLYTAFSRLLETGTIENFVRIRRTDGHLTPLSVHATVLSLGNTPPGRIIVSAHDITRQKQDEAAIQASLDEKVLLLREIHHRVKNNLQIIISLTNLQMRTIDDPGIKQILAETRNRVRAMSLVHEKLYMSENLSSLDLADYTKFLASQLFSFYGVNHLRVTLHTDIEKIPLDIDTAIPLGLILNELISNALKHAFPNDRKGTVRITGHLTGDALMLAVGDDGAGFPPGSDWKTTESLGLRLVTGLVDQLGGTIEKKDGAGTMFIITIHRKTNRGSRS